jgi:hypothetical protein
VNSPHGGEPRVEPEIASGSCLMVGRSRDPG